MEIEQKYRIKSLPGELEEGKKLHQIYLDFENPEIVSIIRQHCPDLSEDDLKGVAVARIREISSGEKTEYFLTLKGKGLAERFEHEKEIKKEEFNELLSFPHKGELEKIRYKVKIPNTEPQLTAEVDQFLGKLDGLSLTEFEYDPQKYNVNQINEVANQYLSNPENVSHLPGYANSNLVKVEGMKELEEQIAKEKEELEKKKEEIEPIPPMEGGKVS